MLRDEDVKVAIGRRVGGGSFVRVTHLPTGRSRYVGPLHGESPDAVIRRLCGDIESELREVGLMDFVDN